MANIKEQAILNTYKNFEKELFKCKTQEKMLKFFDAHKSFFDEFYSFLKPNLENGNFTMLYQPTVLNNFCTGAEALFNLQIGETRINPMVVFALAKQNGFEEDLTLIALDKACKDAQTFLDKINPNFRVGINVSPEICNMSFFEKFCGVLEQNGFPSQNMVVELVETAPFNKENIDVVSSFRDKGFGVALDDFGTGFASEEILKTLPFTHVKFAREIVKGIDKAGDNDKNKNTIENIVDYCQENGLRTIFEGVETETELEAVNKIASGSAIVQGYYYSKSQNPGALEEHIKENGLSENNFALLNAGSQEG